ncbi:MAG: 23S rRNA (guanosine(2251)-2'-O)-methyltransferase RlmB [Bacillota bacterium]
METIQGRNPVTEALKAGRPINKVLLAEGAEPGVTRKIDQLARERGIPVQYIERKRMDNLTEGSHHQGVVAYAAPKEYVDLEDIIQVAKARHEDPLVIVLDHLEDPQNVGAILRSAEASGVHGIVIPKRRGAQLTETVARTSAGAGEYVSVARVANLAQAIDYFKSVGCWAVGTNASAGEKYYEKDLTGPLVVVIGSEGQGISRLVAEHCDFSVSLPMQGRLNSLNVAAATTVILYDVLRQRSLKTNGIRENP